MLILTEKLSVAKDFATALHAKQFDGYFKNRDVTITYCQGHLFELCQPSFYDKKYENWNIADLPIIPSGSATKKIPHPQNRQKTSSRF